MRLARYFGAFEEFWMNLQSNFELRLGRGVPGDMNVALGPLAVA